MVTEKSNFREKGKGQLTQTAEMKMWSDVREKKNPTNVIQNKFPSLLKPQMLPLLNKCPQHIFWCLTGQSVFGVSALHTQQL